MGDAFTAINGDIGALYHNPAGLAGLSVSEISTNLGNFHQGSETGLESGMVFVWSWANFSKKRLAVHWNNWQVGEQNVQQSGVSICGSTVFRDYPLRLGSTIKWRLDTVSHTQLYLIDLGAQSDIIKDKVSAGISIWNLLSGDKELAESSTSWGVLYNSVYGRFNADFNWHSGRYFLSAGWERHVLQGLMIPRLGFLSGPDSFFTAGVSSYLWPIGFDVSCSWPVYSSEGSGAFNIGVRYRFGGKHFSEIYLDRSTEKAASLETKIKVLREERKELVDEIEEIRKFKRLPSEEIFRLPGIGITTKKEVIKKPLPTKPKKPKVTVKPKRKKKRVKKIVWPQYHKVKPGDTLRSIAQRYYGNPDKWQLIYSKNTDKIERGQPRLDERLVIPKP